MQVLYHLAERPELLIPLREEIDGAIAAEGWTMPSFARMWKLDSVLRESQRCNGFTLGALPPSLVLLSPVSGCADFVVVQRPWCGSR